MVLDGEANKLDYTNRGIVALGTGESVSVNHYYPDSLASPHFNHGPRMPQNGGFQYIWNEIPVLVTFESDWKKTKTILQQIATKHAKHSSEAAQKRIQEASQRFMIFYSVLTPAVYTSVENSGVLLTIRYLCEPRTRRGTAETIREDILYQFAAHQDIDFAYPTQRFYNNQREGKAGVRASAVVAEA